MPTICDRSCGFLDGTTLDPSDRANMSIAILPPKGKQEVSAASETERKEMIKHQREVHIIAVDDMKTNLQTIHDILKDDYKVTLLKSGAQLIKYLEKNPYPDLDPVGYRHAADGWHRGGKAGSWI